MTREAYELIQKCQVADLEKFGSEFSSCEKAFRLELLPEYVVSDEVPYFERFKGGEKVCPSEFNAEWIELLESAHKRGAKFRRVRLVADSGPTEYMKFEREWGYSRSALAGEEIRFTDRDLLATIYEGSGLVIDYWLFDDKRCYLILYDFDGRFLGPLDVPSEYVGEFSKASEKLWRASRVKGW